ncbi:unnamed protein product [Trichobilharzia regenti]|nr:unnamed protein product [Trichobilharzia regenti]
MVKKTKKQKLSFPEVQGWVPYKAFSKKSRFLFTYAEAPKDWKEPKFNPEDNPHGRLFASSSYVTLFPKYPRDVTRLLARSVPMEQAIRVLDDEFFADIIEINLNNRERFVKRRNRLIGHDGETLKALELSTNCYIVIQGKTVAVVGRYNDLKEVRRIVQGCIYDNTHPAYSIKRLLIIKKLSMDPTKHDISWDRFLPKMKKKVLSRRRKPHKVRKKKEYNPFPPPPVQSKIDIELEKGTYFLAESERKRLKMESVITKSNKISKERQKAKRAAVLIPPEERNNNNNTDGGGNESKRMKLEAI